MLVAQLENGRRLPIFQMASGPHVLMTSHTVFRGRERVFRALEPLNEVKGLVAVGEIAPGEFVELKSGDSVPA